MDRNVFDKPEEQSEARFSYALARKRLTKYIIYINTVILYIL